MFRRRLGEAPSQPPVLAFTQTPCTVWMSSLPRTQQSGQPARPHERAELSESGGEGRREPLRRVVLAPATPHITLRLLLSLSLRRDVCRSRCKNLRHDRLGLRRHDQATRPVDKIGVILASTIVNPLGGHNQLGELEGRGVAVKLEEKKSAKEAATTSKTVCPPNLAGTRVLL